MARLADEILKGLAPAPWLPRNVPAGIIQPMVAAGMYARKVLTYDPIIDVSNVAEYVWDQQETWSTTDKDQFPCLTPPFPSFFMEYKRPAFFTHERDDLQTEEGRKKYGAIRIGRTSWVRASTAGWPIERYGVLFDSIDLHNGQDWDNFAVPMVDATTGANILKSHIHPDSRWVLRGTLYIKQKGEKQAQGPVAYWIGGLDERGVLLQDAVIGYPATNLMDADDKFYWQTMLTPTFQPALRAISYMHCKNIEQQTHTPPEKLSKAHKKKHGKPLLKYRTLVIQPLMKNGKGSGGGGGGEKSHHFVRGHFADYREKGLFGKESLKRIFWFDMHMRGSKEVGEVIGDYEVKAPESDVA